MLFACLFSNVKVKESPATFCCRAHVYLILHIYVYLYLYLYLLFARFRFRGEFRFLFGIEFVFALTGLISLWSKCVSVCGHLTGFLLFIFITDMRANCSTAQNSPAPQSE